MSAPHICGIYRITSPSGNFYVGSSANVQSRRRHHLASLRKGDHHSAPLQRAANLYGADSLTFEVLCECPREDLRELEQLVIETAGPRYNASPSAYEPLSELWKKPEFREACVRRASEQMKRQWQDPEFVEKNRAAASEALKKMHTDPAFAEASKVRSKALAKAFLHTPEGKLKAADGRRQKYLKDPAALEARREHMRRIGALVTKPVRCLETGARFESIKAAAAWAGLRSKGSICEQLSGRKKTAAGFSWEFC